MNDSRIILTLAVLCLLAGTAAVDVLAQSVIDDFDEWLSIGEYYQMVNEAGEIVMETGRVLGQGDEYLTSANELYRVVRVDTANRLAHAELVDVVDIGVVPWTELLKSAGKTLAGMVDSEPRG